MARGSSRRPGSSPRRPASSRPTSRARATRASAQPGTNQASRLAAASWRGRLTAARSNRRTVRRVAFGVVLLFLVVLILPTLRAYVQQKADISAMRDRVAQQEATVAELKAEQARWADPAYVEQQARTQLKFVKVGEKSYTVIDPEVRDTSGSIAHSPQPTGPWYDTIWSSMKAADVPANRR